jgi:protein O-GlcNAc transferase
MSVTSLQQMMSRATQHHRAGELDEAKALYREILKFQPGHADALHLYGLACHQQGDHAAAVRHIRKAVERVPDQPVLRNNLGDAMLRSGDLAGAIVQLQRALALRPGYAGAHMNLGNVFAKSGDHEAALVHSREAVRLDPEWAEAWFNLGMLQMDQVKLNDSVQSLRKALALRPAYRSAANGLLYVLNLLPGSDPRQVADEHCRVASDLFGEVSAFTAWPERTGKIRIGYVSGDFCAHAVNYFFEPVLQNHDTAHFETFCYSDVTRPDSATRRLRGFARHWRDIVNLPDEQVTGMIRADGIDILVDLAGYTEHGRLGVFAAKPARCQISYLGYPNTTGLNTMDFRVVDQCTAPEGEPLFGTELPLRMPDGFACFRPPAHAPAVQAAPLSGNGYVTFGCLHKLEKLNTLVVETWARVLLQNAGSRLLLARDQLDAWHQHRLEQLFSGFGIDAERLEFVHLADPTQSFLDVFSRIDILLDVFPWSGHTIACCALWMGVPVITLRGGTHAGRMVASVLEGLELKELIAGDAEGYVGIAAGLCQDPVRIARLRAELRDRMERSSLRDEAGFAKAFESFCSNCLNRTEAASRFDTADE